MATVQRPSSAGSSGRGKRRPAAEGRRNVPEASWTPPDVDDRLKTRLGGSVVDEFVAGHDVTDVLRELVQNEFDAGGTAMTVTFGEHGLNVTGNGKAIARDGWSRLSVIIGTGRVVGEDDQAFIERKMNGIGSKNFGLRSLFILGDRIHVRSKGWVAVLDLPRLATARVKDQESAETRGVSIHVPYRTAPFEGLLPFTLAAERRTLDTMASGMLATLAKLALAGNRPGLRQVTLRSERVGREIRWSQRAVREPCKLRGVTAIRRTGTLVDLRAGEPPRTSSFEELEYLRSIDLPGNERDRSLPEYYRAGDGRIRVAVSIPISRKRIDRTRAGHYYYPLQTPHARTGCCVTVSAPFELDGDRSALLPSDWNEWLSRETADLATDLAGSEWLERFGADAFHALAATGPADPDHFLEAVDEYLASKPCWPTRSRAKGERQVPASELIVPEQPDFDNYLPADRYLDQRLSASDEVGAMALKAGAKRFTAGSLVRLRCGGEGASLQTELPDEIADYHYTDYADVLGDPALQARMAAALTKHYRRLSKENRADLRDTASTLAADGSLAPAAELVVVDPGIWDACPEPFSSRLHPSVAPYRAIARFCRRFDDDQWVKNACERASNNVIEPTEREALYRRILDHGPTLSRTAMAAVRAAPVVKDQHGRWASPEEMLCVRGPAGKLFGSVISGPSSDLLDRPELMRRLRIRDRVQGHDLVELADAIKERPALADRFERWLARNLLLLTSGTARQLAATPFLKSAAGTLAAPTELYLDTPLNRLCVNDEALIVGGRATALYRRLKVREAPAVDALLSTIESARAAGNAPPRPDILYAELAAAIAREKRARESLADEPLLWTPRGYFSPAEVIVGRQAPPFLDVAVPVVRGPESIIRSYAAIGAPSHARDEHWETFFRHFAKQYSGGERVSNEDRARLLAAYRERGIEGLPAEMDTDVRCLLDREDFLHSLDELRAGRFLEDDYPPLARALAAHADPCFAPINDRTRFFFRKLGLKSLTSICGSGQAEFGKPAGSPSWLREAGLDKLIAFLHRPAFARALHELAAASGAPGRGRYEHSSAMLAGGLAGIERIAFFETIVRTYVVSGKQASVPGEAAVIGNVLGVVRPRTKFDLHQLVALALTELCGVSDVAETRALAAGVLPLLMCASGEDMRAYLERQGIAVAAWGSDGEESEPDFDFDGGGDASDLAHDILLHLVEGMGSGPAGASWEPPPEPAQPPPEPAAPPPPPAPSPPADTAPAFELPPLDAVTLGVSEVEGSRIEARSGSGGGGTGWSSGYWTPRTAADVVRDGLVGRRGEELVYHQELERVRASGHPNPEQVVVWTSATDAGADHDIRSIDGQGNPRWLEVKSTLGTDGRFEWSQKEFAKALREGKSYELWRVYEAGSVSPVAKCFRDPTSLLGKSQLRLDIASLRAVLEPMS